MSYITNKLVGTVSLNGDIVPTSNVANLGSNTNTFGNLYIGSHSIILSNPNNSVPPTEISINSSNLFTISRGGLAVNNSTGLYDIFQIDPIGTVRVRSNVTLNPNTPAVTIIGNQSGATVSPLNTGVMLQVTGNDGSTSRIYNDSYGTGTYSAFIGRGANGTATVPLQVLAGEIVARVGANPYASSGGPGNGPGFAPLSTARIDFLASENQTGTTRGSNVEIWTTPKGSNVIAKVAAFDADGIRLISNVNIGTDLTVNGNAIIYGTGTSYGNLITYGNLISYGNTITDGTLTTYGNTQIYGATQFLGNVVALKGIVFSDGSNITTAGVSNVSAGAGISVIPGPNYSVSINNTGVRQIYGAPNQITVSGNTGNVQLSLPQDLAPTSNPFFGNLTVGNLTVTGNISATTATDLQVTNRVIYAANGAVTTSAMNLGGFVLGNSQVAASMLYTASNDSWNFNKDIIEPGNIFVSGDLHSTTAYVSSNVLIGTAPPVIFQNALLQITGGVVGTQQLTIQNTSGDSQSSSDIVATADTGNDTVNYIDMGVNSSTYNVTEYGIGGPLDAYVYNNGGNLTIGTDTVGKQIKFHTGGSYAGNIAAFVTQGGRWVFGGADNGTDKIQVSGTVSATGNVNAGNLNAVTVTALRFNGTVAQASQTSITTLGALTNLNVVGSAGIQNNLNVIGIAYAQNSITNSTIFGQTLNVAGAAQVNSIVSNLDITTSRINVLDTVRTDKLIANTAIQSIATLTAQSMVVNTTATTSTMQVTGIARISTMVNNLGITTQTLNTTDLALVDSFVSNTIVTTPSLNVTGIAVVNSLNSNTNVVATNLQSTGLTTVASLISNANIFGSTVNTSGVAQFASVISNGVVTGTTVQGTTRIVGAAINSNTSIQAVGSVIADSVTGNTSVTAPTVSATTILQGAVVNSNSTIQAVGQARVNSLVTNASAYANNVTVGTFVQAGSMISNTIITSGTVNSIGTATVNALVSNVYGVFGQNVVINSTNTATSTTTGALTVAGGVGISGNVYAQSVTLSAGTASQYPLKFTAASALLSPAQAGVLNYDGYMFYGTPSDSQRGVIPTEQIFQLGSVRNLPLVAQPSAVSLFGQSVAVTSNTRYKYEIAGSINRDGANGSGLQFAFGGTAVLTEHDYITTGKAATSNVTITTATMMGATIYSNFSTLTTFIANPGNGPYNFMFRIVGTIGIGTGGTLTPQISLDTGTPTVYNVAPGTWMKLYPIGNTSIVGSNVTIGNWS